MDELQEQETTSGSTPVRQKLESETVMDTGKNLSMNPWMQPVEADGDGDYCEEYFLGSYGDPSALLENHVLSEDCCWPCKPFNLL